VNGAKVIELTCTEVVPLIAQSGPQLDLVVSRRPADIQPGSTTSTDAATGSGKQLQVVVDQADFGLSSPSSLDRKHMKEDVV